MFSKIFKSLIRHKLITAISLLMIVTGGYFGYQGLTKDNSEIQYTIETAEKGTVISSISGTGQVSASDEIEIKSEVSGNVVYLGVKNGQEVSSGAILLQIDARDAQNDMRDAETDLETVRLELEELLQPVDDLDLLRAENDLTQAKESKEEAEDNILEGYEDAFNNIADAFLDLPTVITGAEDVLYSEEISESESFSQNFSNLSVLKNSTEQDYRSKLDSFINRARNDYKTARAKYDQNFENYKDSSRYSGQDVIEDLLGETIETARAISDAVKSETNLLDYWVDYRSQLDLPVYAQVIEYQSELASYTATINSHLSTLLAEKRSLEDNREAVLNAERSIEELEMELAELKQGADELDIRAKQIAVQQKEDALIEAQENMADHYIRAPFSGVVAEVKVKKGESVSSGGAVATFITNQKIAEISLNEIDVARVKVGQKVMISFDAIEGLSLSGEVAEIDTLGAVTSGVVTYDIKITFDTQDERIKPGMSMSASIIVEMSQNVVIVSNSAIKGGESQQYVEILENGSIRQQAIETGISDDLLTEVVSGIKEGDQIVIGQSSVSLNSNQENSSSGNSGGPPEGMQMMRMMQ